MWALLTGTGTGTGGWARDGRCCRCCWRLLGRASLPTATSESESASTPLGLLVVSVR